MIKQVKFRGKRVCQNTSKLEHNKILQYPISNAPLYTYIINSCHCNVPNYIRSFLIEKHRYKSLMPEQSGCLLIYYCRWETLLWLLQGRMQHTPAFQKSNLPSLQNINQPPELQAGGTPRLSSFSCLCRSLLSLSQHSPCAYLFPWRPAFAMRAINTHSN